LFPISQPSQTDGVRMFSAAHLVARLAAALSPANKTG
jgi:hypothetical protein